MILSPNEEVQQEENDECDLRKQQGRQKDCQIACQTKQKQPLLETVETEKTHDTRHLQL